MLCIFCLQEKPPSTEDVFPLAIGGGLLTDRVCRDCNSQLGAVADAPLCSHLAIIAKRAELKLAGQSGQTPDAFEHFLKSGTATLAADPERRVIIRKNSETGQPEFSLSPKKTTLPDGILQIMLDVREAKGQLSKMVQRLRRDQGLSPLSEEQLEQQVTAALATARTEAIETPTIIHNLAIDMQSYRRGVLKIAYELGALWLGDEYLLHDPTAAALRDVVLRGREEQPAGIRGTIDLGVSNIHILSPWAKETNCHIAFSCHATNTIVLALKIFDVIGAVIAISENPEKHCLGPVDPQRFRFLRIHPAKGKAQQSSLIEEIGRVFALGTAPASWFGAPFP